MSLCHQVGSTVEVKSAEGVFSEAVISKLTDASWYTVGKCTCNSTAVYCRHYGLISDQLLFFAVFDDGDEKTLRRTSLCLKGERHFAESEV